MLSMKLIKRIKNSIIFPIASLINKSLSTGEVPSNMKTAKVIPIYKAKDKQLFNNYRPISLLPSISKIMEKIVHQRVYSFLEKYNILQEQQFGFRPKCSTIHAITHFTYEILKNFKQHKSTIGVFLDL